MKTYLFLSFLFTSISIYSQKSINDIIIFDESFYSRLELSDTLVNSINKKIVIDGDTIFSVRNKLSKSEQLEFCRLFRNEKLTSIFLWQLSLVKSIHTFNSPILLFIDKKFKRRTRRNFKSYINSINQLNIVKINFVNDFDDANYVILRTKENLNPEFKESDAKLHLNYPFINSKYKMITDKHKNIRSVKMEISVDYLNSLELERALRQGFYLSLGNFSPSIIEEYIDKVFVYSTLENLSEFEKDILRMNYHPLLSILRTKKDLKLFKDYADANCN